MAFLPCEVQGDTQILFNSESRFTFELHLLWITVTYRVLLSSKAYLVHIYSYTTGIFFWYWIWGLENIMLNRQTIPAYCGVSVSTCSVYVFCIYSKKTAPSAMMHPGQLVISVGVEMDIYLALSLSMIKCYWVLTNKTLYDFSPKI